ncbi:MAG: hypothetical protein EPO68_14410 [Planctomycetota bacterium]|nr:MAG: hypothetical protein EPO68_14410 [Planctomycetota bacterium]
MCSSALILLAALSWAPARDGAAHTPPAPAAKSAPAASPARAALPTRDEALALLCPGARWIQETLYPTSEQLAKATELAGEKVESRVLVRHAAYVDGKLALLAYFDTHRVRSLGETLLVALEPGGRVRRVEVVAFAEPRDYLPREKFYAQLAGRELDKELRLDRGVQSVAGATLTARATVAATRRVLALQRALPAPAASQPTPAK